MKDLFSAPVPSLERCYLHPTVPVLILQLDSKVSWGKQLSHTSVPQLEWTGPLVTQGFSSTTFSLLHQHQYYLGSDPQLVLIGHLAANQVRLLDTLHQLSYCSSYSTGLPTNLVLLLMSQVKSKLLGMMTWWPLPLQAHPLLLRSDFILPLSKFNCCSLIGYAVACL